MCTAKQLSFVIAAGLLACLAGVTGKAAEPQLAHAVYFKLAEPTGAGKEKLVEACKKYLAEHTGTVHFSAGVRDAEMNRDVNDQDWDVFLLVIFKNKAAHDKYQTHPRHLKFIDECKDAWQSVRVFDALLATPGGSPD